MAKQKEKFKEGCVKNSKWSEKKAKEVWKWIEPFAAYGFNKAHSVSYGRVAYITAYLKAHFPEIYLSAVLTSEQGETDKVAALRKAAGKSVSAVAAGTLKKAAALVKNRARN